MKSNAFEAALVFQSFELPDPCFSVVSLLKPAATPTEASNTRFDNFNGVK